MGRGVWGQCGGATGSVVGGKVVVQWAVLLGGGMRSQAVTSKNQQKVRGGGEVMLLMLWLALCVQYTTVKYVDLGGGHVHN